MTPVASKQILRDPALAEALAEVKERLPMSAVLATYGIRTHRVSPSRTRILCPFHRDTDPSCVLYDDQRFHCFGCLEENEPVWTSRGLRPIGDLEVGEHVLDHQGHLRQIVAKRVRQDKFLAVGTGAFRRDPLRLTPDHVCLFVPEAHALEALPYIFHTSDRNRVRMMNSVRQRRRGTIVLSEGRADGLRVGDFLVFPIIPHELRLPHELLDSDGQRGRGKCKCLKPIRSLPINEQTAWLYGIWLAEGSVSGGRVVRFTFAADERESLAQETLSILAELGCSSSVYAPTNKRVCEVLCCRVDLAKHLERWFGKGAGEKGLPYETLFWPQEIQKALVAGYFAGDGAANSPTVKTVSPKLAYGVFALLTQAGMIPSLSRNDAYIGDDGIRRRESWQVRAREKQGLDCFFERIGNLVYYWSRITCIEALPGDGTAVDITVEGSNTFLTKMCAVHNCGARGDVVDLLQALEGHESFVAALRSAAQRAGVHVPARTPVTPAHKWDVLFGVATEAYAALITPQAVTYLASRGFPNAFIRAKQIGYAPPQLKTFLTSHFKSKMLSLREATACGLVVHTPPGATRDTFASAGGGYLVFPVRKGARVVDLQGRAWPEEHGKPKYLNLPGKRQFLYGEDALGGPWTLLCEGIPDAMSCELAGLPAVAVFGVYAFKEAFVSKFRRCRRVYVCFDTDAVTRAAEVACAFGVRGRVVLLPKDLGLYGDLNNLLVISGSPDAFRSRVQALLLSAPTGYALRIDALCGKDPLELYGEAAGLLAELHGLDPISRALHLQRLSKITDLPVEVLETAAAEAAAHSAALGAGNPPTTPATGG